MGIRKSIGDKLRFDVLRRDRFTCQYCGESAPNVILELDHRLAHSKGGSDKEENLVTSCRECNRGKGDRDGDIYRRGKKHMLEELFFHEMKGREVCRQGMVLEVSADRALVLYFDFILGYPSHRATIKLDDMGEYRFYATDDEMNEAYDRLTPP